MSQICFKTCPLLQVQLSASPINLWRRKSGSPPINSISLRESLGSFVSQPGEKNDSTKCEFQVTLEFNWSPLWEVTIDIDALESASSVEATVSPSSDQMTGSEFYKKNCQKNHPKKSPNHLFIVFGQISSWNSPMPSIRIWTFEVQLQGHLRITCSGMCTSTTDDTMSLCKRLQGAQWQPISDFIATSMSPTAPFL